MSDDFDREEQAFRDAFVRELEGEGFRPLDADQLKAAAPVRRLPGPWLKGLAAAAAVVLVVGGAGVVLPRLFLAGSAASGSVAAAPAEDRAGAAAGGVSGKDTSGEALPVPAASGAYAESSDWVETASSPLAARVGAAAAWLDGSFYVVGGREPQACAAGAACPAPRQTMVDGAAYDPAADAWVLLPDAPIVVADAAPAVVGSRLYYLGTADGPGGAPAFAAFDAVSRTWQQLAAPREAGRLFAAGDRVVSLGSGAAVGQLYDPATDLWSDLPADPWTDTVERSAVWVDARLLVFTLREAEAGKSGVRRLAVTALNRSGAGWEKLGTVTARGEEPVAVAGVIAWAAGANDTVYWVGSSLESSGAVAATGGGSGLEGLVGVVVGDRLGASGDARNTADLYDFDAGAWLRLTAPPGGNEPFQTVAGSPSGLLVVGGDDGSGNARASFLPLG